MNRLKYITYTFIIVITTPSMLMASTSGGGALASEIQGMDTLDQIADLLTGELLIGVAIIAGAAAGYGFFRKNNGHGSRWEKLMWVGIGLIVVSSIGGVIRLLFSGATL